MNLHFGATGSLIRVLPSVEQALGKDYADRVEAEAAKIESTLQALIDQNKSLDIEGIDYWANSSREVVGNLGRKVTFLSDGVTIRYRHGFKHAIENHHRAIQKPGTVFFAHFQKFVEKHFFGLSPEPEHIAPFFEKVGQRLADKAERFVIL